MSWFRKAQAPAAAATAAAAPQPAREAGTVKVAMTVNGKAAAADVDPRTLLVQFLRENLRLTGTHVGCDTSQCGACVVHLDGRAVKSCTVLAASCDGAKVTTIEGLAKDGKLHPMQEAFRQHHGLQCGFCTPGMIMAAVDLATPQGRQPRRAHHARGARGQPVPLHGLSQHRRRRAGRRRRHGRHAPGRRIACRCTSRAERSRRQHEQTQEEQRHGRHRHRGVRQAQGRPAVHHRQGPVHRRHQPPRPDLGRVSCARRTRTPTSSRSTPPRR